MCPGVLVPESEGLAYFSSTVGIFGSRGSSLDGVGRIRRSPGVSKGTRPDERGGGPLRDLRLRVRGLRRSGVRDPHRTSRPDLPQEGLRRPSVLWRFWVPSLSGTPCRVSDSLTTGPQDYRRDNGVNHSRRVRGYLNLPGPLPRPYGPLGPFRLETSVGHLVLGESSRFPNFLSSPLSSTVL